jgi:subtilisin family serine protease
MRTWVLLSLALALALGPAWYASTGRGRADEGPNPPLVERTGIAGGEAGAADQLAVRFKAGVSDGAARSVVSALGGEVVKKQPRSGIQRVAVPNGKSVQQALSALRRSPLVAEANVVRVATILDTPNDTNYSYQWHMHNTDGGMWADIAWNLAPNRGANVTVAVIDSGVAFEDYNTSLNGDPQSFKVAPDLASTTFVAPWDFYYNDAHPNDDNGHGTHVAGTIAQNTNNSYGVAGVAYNARIMPIKVLDHNGDGFGDDIVEGIYHAVANGADVINMSIGFPGSGGGAVPCSEIAGLNDALDYAHSQGVVLIAAAGNDGGMVSCPAAHPAVISVGAAGYDGQATWYSNNGAALDISAPGGDPLVDLSGDGYVDGVLQETFCYDANTLLLLDLYGSFCNVFNAGTSMASPHVAGTAALLLGEDPSLTPDEVRALLESTARDRGPTGWDPNYGWGALDAAGALASMLGVPKPTPTPVPGLDAPTNLTATALSSSVINLAWTDNASAETGYKIERSTDAVNFSQIAIVPANYTSYPSQGLPGGTTFHYRVRAYGGANHSPFSNVASATTQPVPAAPTNLNATAASSSRINLTWTDDANNETGFKIERSTDGSNFAQVGVVGANISSTSNLNLTGGTIYYYRVRAFEGPNHSAFSNTATATTQPTPAAPTNLTATTVSSSQINLAWTDNATNEAGFKVERSTDGVNFTQLAALFPNKQAYSSTGLTAGTTYHFRVRAYDGPNHSTYSNVAFATTSGGPGAPSNLAATAASSSRINLTWIDNSTTEGGFKLERSTDGVNFSQLAVLAANTTSYASTGLNASTSYHYRIRSYEGANNSAFSNVASATTEEPPAAPSNLNATAVSSSQIKLTWTDNATNEAGFKLERSTDGVNFTQIGTLLANATSYSATSLTASTTYHFRVRAYDGNNHSSFSNVAFATTKPVPAAPSNLVATPSAGKITLTWTDNASNEMGFKLERSTDGVNFTQLGFLAANTTSFPNAGLASGVTYHYRIRAYDGPNHSAYSNVASATVP